MRIGKQFWVVSGLAGALTLAVVSPSTAAPVSTGAAALKSAAPSDVTTARWRGRGRGWGYFGGGFATGLAIGALASRPYYNDPYYYGYYYGPPPVVYGPPAPAYVSPYPDPNGPRRQCWVTTDDVRGYGYFRPC
jgi:hypothetical protein